MTLVEGDSVLYVDDDTVTLAVDNTPNDRTVVVVGEHDNEEVHQRHSRLLSDHVAVTRAETTISAAATRTKTTSCRQDTSVHSP